MQAPLHEQPDLHAQASAADWLRVMKQERGTQEYAKKHVQVYISEPGVRTSANASLTLTTVIVRDHSFVLQATQQLM